MALQTLGGIAATGTSEAARVAAAIALLDRGWGKPPQAHTGEDGEGKIRVTIRHIVEGRDVEPRVVEQQRALDHVKQIDNPQSEDEL